ncbi:MAG: TVP38/TMEM64 family protein [Betaproteobacteria bacterium]
MQKRVSPAWGKILAITVVLAGIAAAWRYTSLSEFITAENAIEWAHRLRHMPGAPIAVALAYTVAAIVMFPRPIITLTTIVAFGTLAGVAYAALGIEAAALAFFYAGRLLPQRWILKLGGRHMPAVQEMLREHGVLAIFALNMVPAPPFAVQGMIAGASKVRTLEYMLGSLLGMLPTLAGWAFFGHKLSASLEGNGSISAWVLAPVVLAMVIISLLVRRWVRAHSTLGRRPAPAGD